MFYMFKCLESLPEMSLLFFTLFCSNVNQKKSHNPDVTSLPGLVRQEDKLHSLPGCDVNGGLHPRTGWQVKSCIISKWLLEIMTITIITHWQRDDFSICQASVQLDVRSIKWEDSPHWLWRLFWGEKRFSSQTLTFTFTWTPIFWQFTLVSYK